MADIDKDTMAKLNEVLDLLSALNTGQLRQVLEADRPPVDRVSCGTDCTCNDRMCGCRGSVKKVLETTSFAEFLSMREQRMKELRDELEALKIPSDLKNSD